MAVIVINRRTFQMESDIEEELAPLLKKLHTLSKKQPGYIATWTLRNADDPSEYLVSSRWETVDDWKRWLQSKERRDLQGEVDSMIGEKTFFGVWELLEWASSD